MLLKDTYQDFLVGGRFKSMAKKSMGKFLKLVHIMKLIRKNIKMFSPHIFSLEKFVYKLKTY
ncbi:hypothetical protein DCC85_05105 [Paenibacillus sp. CAA11]|nr:hypothetical protein DCC85_05105 [Paenibacillus sp. CAA11]